MCIRDSGYTIEIQADEEVYVKCDENKISQAFYNLMDNAVNHTGEDKTVVIRQIVTDDKVRIEISDSGPGISPEELPYIDVYKRQCVHGAVYSKKSFGAQLSKCISKLVLSCLAPTGISL